MPQCGAILPTCPTSSDAASPAHTLADMAKRFPLHPAHPERACWGCDRYCPAQAMACGNGSDRTQHPEELFGPDWADWVPPAEGERSVDTATEPPTLDAR